MQPIAYFSPEIGISEHLPTYGGGLGILAGDILKGAADLGLPMVGVTLLYREGYLRQRIEDDGAQRTLYTQFHPESLLEREPVTVSLRLQGRMVRVQAWRYDIHGRKGTVPVYLLDTDRSDNHPEDRTITHRLYHGYRPHRITQEAVLGYGGLGVLRALGRTDIGTYHLNEGHCAFLQLALLKEAQGDVEAVRKKCVFTTHTPVPEGHEVFPYSLVHSTLAEEDRPPDLHKLGGNDALSMTVLALNLSRKVNAVSKLHGVVARSMFPDRDIGYVTNGVHLPTWVSPHMQALYDRTLPGWREDPWRLGEAANVLPDDDLARAHLASKRELLAYANAQTDAGLSEDVLTLGFARRAAPYKRAYLLFRNRERLLAIGRGRLQVVFAGKSHPDSEEGLRIIRDIVQIGRQLAGQIRVVYLENYNIWLGRLLTAGVDVWLNTPRRPHEASGTSGMKAAFNGVPNCSISDGWWAEGAQDGQNGWIIGDEHNHSDEEDAESLMRTLEERVVPGYYGPRERWLRIMKNAIATAPEYSAERMLRQYSEQLYI